MAIFITMLDPDDNFDAEIADVIAQVSDKNKALVKGVLDTINSPSERIKAKQTAFVTTLHKILS